MDSLQKISVINPVSEAIEKTRILLFKPFNLEKWFIIGFCAWLANMIREGVRGSINFKFPNSQETQEWAKVTEYVKENLLMVGIIAAIAVTTILAVVLVVLWLNSRGRFMFVDCLAKNKAQVVEPWRTFRRQANSLFRFRLLLIVVSYGIITVFSLPIIFLALAMRSDSINFAVSIAAISGIVFIIIIIALFFGLIKGLTLDFIVPTMYIRRINTLAAWKIFLAPLKTHFWKIILYFLFKFLILLSIGAITFGILFVGCCCLCGVGILLFIPYIGTVILLPFACFTRLYTLCFLRQFGREYDVFV
ncbi:MAG: hypothetical protein A2Y10_07130 [Planctomycetes bacterium GWF2_41_51]|nr:MAG: hypothetical protein A2Y10_07130 [Planctomycetes bacterium GWF2_41_51]HBG28762.1 hypothetical protein [Phycisphaerales bacterium]